MNGSSLALSETCVASVSNGAPPAIPALGGAEPWGIALLSIAVLLVAGTLLLVIGRRRNRARSTPHEFLAASALALLLTVATFGLAPPSPANAAPPSSSPSVEYSAGCSLIRVDQVAAHEGTSNMLPGDQVILLEARVTNVYSAPVLVTLSAAGEPSGGVGAPVVLHAFATGSTSGQIRLAPGESAATSLAAQLPLDTDNSAQGASLTATLIFSATEQ